MFTHNALYKSTFYYYYCYYKLCNNALVYSLVYNYTEKVPIMYTNMVNTQTTMHKIHFKMAARKQGIVIGEHRGATPP